MNKLLAIIATVLQIIILSCASGGTTQPSSKTQPQAAARTPAAALWTGDGGKGISIAILAPHASGLAANQAYLPAMVQGEFVSNFSGYSAISVLDRVRLDEQYAELLSGYYSDDAGLDLGKLTPTSHIMGGNITRTATGYVLQMYITKTSDKTTAASYSGTFTFAELDNLSGIRRTSLDLLQKMGITPTAAAQRELSGAAATNHVNAQTALAQGIAAQKQGNTAEAMALIYEAAAYDTSIAEAAARANTMSANIRTGSMGQNIRNDIAWHDEWAKIMGDAKRYLQANPPVVALVVYGTSLEQGRTDYDRRTVQLSFDIEFRTVPFPNAVMKMMNDLNIGLYATGRNRNWRLQYLTPQNIWGRNYEQDFSVSGNASLLNNAGRVIASARTDSVPFIIGETGSQFYSRGYSRGGVNNSFKCSFTVNADQITDNMTISVSPAISGSNFRFACQVLTRAAASNSAANAPIHPLMIFNKETGTITRYIGNARDIVIPSTIDGVSVTAIGDRAFVIEDPNFYRDRVRLSVTIPPSVRSIGEHAFNDVNVITIGAKVSMRDSSFPEDRFRSFRKRYGGKAGTYRRDFNNYGEWVGPYNRY